MTHYTIIYSIVGLIICVQLFFFVKNLKKILSYKDIIASNKNLSVIELHIGEEDATKLDPEYFLHNKRFFENKEDEIVEETFEEETDETQSNDEEDELNFLKQL